MVAARHKVHQLAAISCRAFLGMSRIFYDLFLFGRLMALFMCRAHRYGAWSGHIARAPPDHPVRVITNWRPPLWWHFVRCIGGDAWDWRHNHTNWHRGPEDSVANVLGP